jgi:RHS repeat-associated protein
VLEEKVGSNTTNRYVWSPVYVDALVLRDRDADGNPANGLEERLWAQQDANYNVTALVDGTGAVVERYAYDPFGSVTVYDGSYTVRTGGSSYAWVYLHQGLRWDAAATLYDNFNRWYSPSLGRFTSLDPIRFSGEDVNLYRSVGNDPISRVDPSGLAGPSTTPPTHLIAVTCSPNPGPGGMRVSDP